MLRRLSILRMRNLLLLLGVAFSVVATASYAYACGGLNERACCVTERVPSCDSGLVEVSGCSGSCTCGGFNPAGIKSLGTCRAPAPLTCGANGQRACCVTERIPSCNSGLIEVSGCPGSCRCGGANPLGLRSSGTCRSTVTCGGHSQRACCITERAAPCNEGLVRHLGCEDNCLCGGTNPGGVLSEHKCLPPTACGDVGQRACCVGETDKLGGRGGCIHGLVERDGCSEGCRCGPGSIGENASGTCVVASGCGKIGQRACCLGERGRPTGARGCESGLVERSGCSGDCLCGPGAVATSSSGTCVAFSDCGAPGQRACCVGEEGGPALGGCEQGLVEESGCSDNCRCGPGALAEFSSSSCHVPPPCGAEGQRACCLVERSADQAPCNDGLIEVGGCEGGPSQCACGNSRLGEQSSSTCEVPDGCGGENMRACCLFETKGIIAGCASGLTEIPGCGGDCEECETAGTCIKASACGGKGQRACCLGERLGEPCDGGLEPVEGCTGDCFCGKGLLGTKSAHTCSVMERVSEPTIGRPVGPTNPSANPLYGYADLHLHLFAHMAHGGGVLSGESYDPQDGVNSALKADFQTDKDLVNKDGNDLPSLDCPAFLGPNCGDKLLHGDHNNPFADDPIGSSLGTKDGAHSYLGAPTFNSWPLWSSTTHQQSYYTWLNRARLGGLRLISMLAVTNEALCKGNKRLSPEGCESWCDSWYDWCKDDGVICSGTCEARCANMCEDSMLAIDAQLAAAYDFQDFIDQRSGGTGRGWFRIVNTPEEARSVIRAGNLAVVLGIEVDNLFNCKATDDCTPDYVRSQLVAYRKRGVRHVFPIHNFDNAFGGPATWQDAINVGNRVVEGSWWETEECPEEGIGPYGFRLSEFMQTLIRLLGFGTLGGPGDQYNEQKSSCNVHGLTDAGNDLVRKMMQLGMVVDIDHMSRRSVANTFGLAGRNTPTPTDDYPLVASHVQFFELNKEEIRHERMRTRTDLQRIAAGGGMVAAMLKDDTLDTGNRGKKLNRAYSTPAVGQAIADDCRHSSKTFAQMVQYAADVTGGAVAMGSDFNGVAGHFAPRFGSEACGGDAEERSAQIRGNKRVEYPFVNPQFGTFNKQRTGQRTYDYNVHGLAHVGLLPDMMEDLKTIGLNQQYLDAIYRSAEAFIDVWERAERAIYRFPGDANMDCSVGFDDFLTLASEFGQSSVNLTLRSDFDGNHSVDFADFLKLARNFGQHC